MIHNSEYPLVTFLVKENQYAISAKHVSNMVAVPTTRPVPQAPAYVRGIINLRGSVMPLIDLRVRLGFRSAVAELDELTNMLAQREQDHQRWLIELEASVREQREFTLTTDPHRCAFGKWYDQYQPTDQSAEAMLKKFDRPHKKIHALAHKVEKYQAQGDFAAAQSVIDQGRTKELLLMVKLFSNFNDHVREAAREIAMIVETPLFDYAVAIDEVRAVEFLAPGTIESLPQGLDNGQVNNLVGLIGRRQSDNSTVQILDSKRICDPDDVKGLILPDEAELQPA